MVKKCKDCGEEKDISLFYKKGKTTVSYCDSCCKKRAKNYARARITEGKCRNCSSPRMKTTRYCLTHLVKRICDFHHIDHALIPKLIKKLKDQNFECYYTGVLLVPGLNLSVDHIIPKKAGLDNNIENLVWCDMAINKMKQGTDVATFLEKSKHLLDEFRFLASLETPEQKQVRLSYVLGNYS